MATKIIDYTAAITRPFKNLKETSIIALLAMLVTVSSTLVSLWAIASFRGVPVDSLWQVAAIAGVILAPIAGLFLMGYLLEIPFSKKMPGFKSSYFKQGFLGSVVSLLYFLPVSILLMAVFWVMRGAESTAAVLTSILFLVMVFVIVCIWSFITPMALLTFVKKGFKNAFTKEVFKKCFTKTYFIAWLFVVAFSFAVDFVVNLFTGSITGIVGLIVAVIFTSFGTAITGITGFTVYGEAYKLIKK